MNSNESDDRVGALLRLTGRRPAVPVDRAERVQAAVRAHWQAEVDRRSRRRWVTTAAVLATAATLVLAAGLGFWRREGPSPARGPVGRVEVVSGPASMGPASRGAWASTATVRSGEPVAPGSELATEERGRLAIRLVSGESVRLDEGTRVRVLSGRTLAVDRGAVYVDSGGEDGRLHDPIEIRTPLGSIRDIGTQFEVRILDTSVRVRVREGSVSVDRPAGGLEVAAGHELEVQEDGRIDRRRLATFGADWAWVAEVLPAMDLEGRSLREFLEWVARESGRRLRLASPELAASASTITLNGSIEGMTLDQAVASVLATCGMAHRTEGNALIVEAIE